MDSVLMTMRLFGALAVTREGGTPLTWPTRHTGLILAMLTEPVGRPVSRAQLISSLWPYSDADSGRNRLRVALVYLRKVTEFASAEPGLVLTSDRSAITLSEGAVWVDTAEFTRLVERSSRTDDRVEAKDALKRADALYVGDFLPDCTGEWADGRRAHYARLQSGAQHKLAGILAADGEYEAALRQSERSIHADPLREAPRRRHVRLLVEAGERATAVEEFEEYSRLLRREIGLSPSDEFAGWMRDIRSGRAGKGQREPVSSTTATTEPVAVRPDSAPLIYLPAASTSFVGRRAELAALSELLLACRSICLVGDGGMGKTRLAIELARENSSGFSAGVYFVTIGANAAPSAVLASLARQAGVTRVGEPISGLKAAFAGSSGSNPRTALILLDGCEHLTGNGEEIRRRLLVELPTVTIISTSRRTHVLPGEQCFSVLALESPTVDSVDGLENSSVQLFVERARKVSPHFTITGSNRRSVIEICRRLEGIPLSIELAAGRVNRSSPDSILRDLLERSGADEKSGWKEQRNRSFHTNLASSLSTLDGDFRTRFCSLAVFKNTFDAAAAQAVGGASREDLQRLTSLNLVTTVGELADMRFHLLDTVREFAWNELPKPLSRSISERHAVYYRHLVWSAERFHMSSGITRFPNLTVEDENIRQAFDWSLQSESAEIVGAYVLGLVWHWIYNGAQRQGREFVALARDRFRPNGLPGAQLDAAEGILASFSDDAETSRRCLTAALGFYETQTKSVYEIIVRSMLGYADYVAGEYESALHRVELNYARLVEAKYERALAGECHLMALCLAQFGRYQEAIEWNLRSLELWTAQGDLAYRGYAYLALGRTYWSSSDFESARNWYLKAITQFDELADARCFAYAVEGLGRISADEHHYADAGTLFGASQQVRDSIALGRDFADARDFDRSMHKVNAGLGDKAEAEWESGYGMSTKEITAWIRNRFVSSDSP